MTLPDSRSEIDIVPFTREYKGLPRIAGMPKIVLRKYSPLGFKIPDEPKIFSFINFPIEVGRPQALITGIPGSGKSNIITLLMAMCMARGEAGLINGDAFNEWAHFMIHGFVTKKNELINFPITLFIPEGAKIEYEPEDLDWGKRGVEVKPLQSVDQVIENLKRQTLTVVFDECFWDPKHENLYRLRFWNDLALKLVRRKGARGTPICWAHHEFSELVPQSPAGKMYDECVRFANLFFKFRKAYIRTLFVGQLLTEIFYRISRKRFIEIKKRSDLEGMVHGMEEIHEIAKNLNRNESIWVVGGRFCVHSIEMFPEIDIVERMIPQNTVTWPYNLEEVEEDNKAVELRLKLGKVLSILNRREDIPQTTIASMIDETREFVRYNQGYYEKSIGGCV